MSDLSPTKGKCVPDEAAPLDADGCLLLSTDHTSQTAATPSWSSQRTKTLSLVFGVLSRHLSPLITPFLFIFTKSYLNVHALVSNCVKQTTSVYYKRQLWRVKNRSLVIAETKQPKLSNIHSYRSSHEWCADFETEHRKLHITFHFLCSLYLLAKHLMAKQVQLITYALARLSSLSSVLTENL